MLENQTKTESKIIVLLLLFSSKDVELMINGETYNVYRYLSFFLSGH